MESKAIGLLVLEKATEEGRVKLLRRKRCVFVSLPTGGGKRSILPWAFDDLYDTNGSITIVVSPLIW